MRCALQSQFMSLCESDSIYFSSLCYEKFGDAIIMSKQVLHVSSYIIIRLLKIIPVFEIYCRNMVSFPGVYFH